MASPPPTLKLIIQDGFLKNCHKASSWGFEFHTQKTYLYLLSPLTHWHDITEVSPSLDRVDMLYLI